MGLVLAGFGGKSIFERGKGGFGGWEGDFRGHFSHCFACSLIMHASPRLLLGTVGMRIARAIFWYPDLRDRPRAITIPRRVTKMCNKIRKHQLESAFPISTRHISNLHASQTQKIQTLHKNVRHTTYYPTAPTTTRYLHYKTRDASECVLGDCV